MQKNMNKKKNKKRNTEYTVVAYSFVFIFLSLILWMVYFNVYKSDRFINSPYNKRQNSFADRVIRGDILSADGQVLATSKVDEEGKERRQYPYGEIFAHAVGYASNGKSGLEAEANFDLLTSHDFIVTKIENELQNKKNKGDNIITTLDSRLQEAAYNALEGYNGAAVVLQPSSGKILAMVSKPAFDPNTIEEDWKSIVSEENNSVLVNRATQGLYPPGSTFKIITTLSYLRKHGSLEGFSHDCTGEIATSDGHVIHCYNSIAHGQETLREAFENSCNTAFSLIGNGLGAKQLNKTAKEMLFNEKLPLTMLYKKSSFTLTDKDAQSTTMLTSIGQGNTLVTPMHMAMIVSAIANGGGLMKPYMIEAVENTNKDMVRKIMPNSYKKLMTADEAAALSSLMQGVVTRGTAAALSNDSYSVAGKTGSAEYYMDGEMKTHSWFVGFSNVDNPDLVVAVIAEEGGAGSEVAVPAAKRIMDTYYNLR